MGREHQLPSLASQQGQPAMLGEARLVLPTPHLPLHLQQKDHPQSSLAQPSKQVQALGVNLALAWTVDSSTSQQGSRQTAGMMCMFQATCL